MSARLILDDERPIDAIYCEDRCFRVLEPNPYGIPNDEPYRCDRIEPYPENGLHTNTVWFRVWRGPQIIARVNGFAVHSIHYDVAQEEEKKTEEPRSPALQEVHAETRQKIRQALVEKTIETDRAQRALRTIAAMGTDQPAAENTEHEFHRKQLLRCITIAARALPVEPIAGADQADEPTEDAATTTTPEDHKAATTVALSVRGGHGAPGLENLARCYLDLRAKYLQELHDFESDPDRYLEQRKEIGAS
jgi:hypothetical protein